MDESIDELCGNNEQYEEIRVWLQKQLVLQNSTKLTIDNLLFVSGNSGIGKTHSIKHICKTMNLHMVYISTHNCWSAEELNDLLIKNTSSSMIQVLSNDTKKKVIVIDDFESMMAIDRTINTTLLNILTNGKLKCVPIVCIASCDIVKKVGMLKKKCKIIEIPNPSDDDIIKMLLKSQLKHDDMHQIERIEKIERIERIVRSCGGNISQCLNKLENLCDDMDTSVAIGTLYGNNFHRDNIRKLVMTDPWLIPLRFHENLITELKNKKSTIGKNQAFYKKFMYDLLYFDLLIHNNCIELACDYFASIIYFSYTIHPKKNAATNLHNFTKILSYLSLQKKYSKKSYSSNFPLYQIGNYHTNIIGRNFMFFN